MALEDDPRYEVIWLIRRLFRSLAALADGYLADSGLTAADRAVLEFLFPDRRLTVPEIAALYDVSRQHVQATVNGLVATGLVESHPNPRHKRSAKFGLSGAGRDTFGEIRANERALIAKLFAGLTDEQVATTRDTLRSLKQRAQ